MSQTRKYYLLVLGCQMNHSDAERAAAILNQAGFKSADSEKSADLIVVLACSVRQKAVDRIFGKTNLWQKRRARGELTAVLTGCVLPSDQKKLRNKFDFILPINKMNQLSKELNNLPAYQLTSYFHIHPRYNSKFQAEVPIMTGCNNFCAYCVVPYVRGREISRPAQEIINECRALIKNGYKEITLLGQNVNSYNAKRKAQSAKQINFPQLLKEIDKIEGDYWLRFITSHPKDLSDELIKVMADGKHITPHLHLPIQAGDDQILKTMNRGYTVSHYLNLAQKVRKAIPNLMLSTDVIVGFPGETRKQFANTAKLFKKVKFDMAYLAQYSPRPGTAAFKLKDSVSQKEKKRRWQELTKILKITALENNQKLLGQTLKVLVEDYKNKKCLGKTETFKTVSFSGDKNLIGQFTKVKIERMGSWGMGGKLKIQKFNCFFMSKKLIVILGPTSAGKTKLAARLAARFNGEIISADSRQVYRGMDIGTGKDLNDYVVKRKVQSAKRKNINIPYHLINVVNPKTNFNVAKYQKLAYQAIANILGRGKVPFLVGGTGLYLDAVIKGYAFNQVKSSKFPPKADAPLAQKVQSIRKKLNKLTVNQLLARLKKADPKTYQIIDKKNRRRVQRALEIYYEAGRPKSAQLKMKKPDYDILIIGLKLPLEKIYKRIDERLKKRLKEGMIKEVKKLHQQGVDWKRLENFGLEYRWVSRYLQGKISYLEMGEELKKAIHHFARRQLTWFRRNQDIIWISNLKEMNTKIVQFLKK